MADPIIEARGLTKDFGDHRVVDGLSLSVRRGEVFGLLGPNGAGKTTTLRMLAALVAPSGGEASVDGLAVGRDDEAIRGRIGILTETPGLYPRLSARQNLRLHAELQGVGEPEAVIDRYLALFDLSDRRDDLVGGFSKGMRQKVAIARALLHEPPILFLDEPTSGLDPASARAIRGLVEELANDEGRTVILTTHNLDIADRLCDRVAIFERRVLAEGTPRALRRRLYGEVVRVRLRDADDALLAAVRALPFVRSAAREGDRLEVTVGDLVEDNPRLLSALVARGAAVILVEEHRESLEQVFLDIVARARAGEAGLPPSGAPAAPEGEAREEQEE